MKTFCPMCDRRLKWFEIILWGRSVCDDCYKNINTIQIVSTASSMKKAKKKSGKKC